MIDKNLGNYQILQEIGRGGMGVVYRAYQPSLNRYVAIKVLPPQFTFDSQFVERFQREARAAAGLRHPNIVVIHDVGQENDTYYIVMEFLEGRTLRHLIQQEGPLPPRRVTHILEQVAAALDYAHQRGFVHRDIKPANIFVGDGDRVTLTDFGIAKAASETQQLTRTGTLMGTPEYMSPEQAEGGTVDHRTDLYALGVVLYQMLVGRVPFRGTTPHAVLHDVIYEPPPPPRQINPNLSPALEAAILKSIAKQPDRRFQRGAEMIKALRRAMAGAAPADAGPAPLPTPRRGTPAAASKAPDGRRTSPVVWILAGIAAVLVLIIGGLLLLASSSGNDGTETPVPVTTTQAVARETSQPQDTATTVAAPAATATAGQAAPSPTSVSDTPLPPPTDTPEPPTNPPPTATPTTPPPTDTPVAPTATSAASYGKLVFVSDRDGDPEIYVVNLAGGSPQQLTYNNTNDWLPDWSPDGSRIVFTSYRSGSYDLWVMNADGSGQTAWVTTGAWDEYGRWAPDGQRLSLSTTANTQGVANSEIFVRQSNGNLSQVTYSTAENQWADWAPDGRLIYTQGFQDSSDWDIYISNADGSNLVAWLDGSTCDVQPTWSPNGQRIAFLRISQDTNGNGRIDFEDAGDVWVGQASGNAGLQALTSGAWASTPAWSPDGQWIAYGRVRDTNQNGISDNNDAVDIWAIPADGGEAVPLIRGPDRDGNPSWAW